MSVLLVVTCLLGAWGPDPAPHAEGDVVATALLDAGAAPRRVLRLAQRPGWGQGMVASVASEVETASGVGAGRELRTEYGPEVLVPLRVEWLAEEGRGRARYHLRVGRPEVHAVDEEGMEPAWRLAEELGAMSGRAGEVLLSDRGTPLQAWIRLGPDASSALRSLVQAALTSDWLITPQFPEEPVGPGARWAVARALGPEGLAVVAYELVAQEGGRGRVRFFLHARDREGRSAPRAEGELWFDLRRPFPERLEVVYSSRAELGPRGGRRLEVVRRARVTLESGGPMAPGSRAGVEAPWMAGEEQVRAP
ncbi:hypothetical protein [Corallococcus macrosporus]|uniref:hypothetical protein n=1 Tax=Corallococcus macrosporus TaxID=35 RepID=UPI0006833410|nr:hypothetical protein [Corallococcus macrosporus]